MTWPLIALAGFFLLTLALRTVLLRVMNPKPTKTDRPTDAPLPRVIPTDAKSETTR